MNQDYEPDLLTLLDDDGVEHEFEIIDEIDIEEGHFLALVPTKQAPDSLSVDPDIYYIFEVVEIDGEEQLQELEDDKQLDRIADIFEDRFNNALFEE